MPSPSIHVPCRRVPESLNKVISVPRSLHPHLEWWLEESNLPPGQLLHLLTHALQIFTDATKERWGADLNERTARGTGPQTGLQLRRLPGGPERGQGRPTPEQWQALTDKIQTILSCPVCQVRQFMSLIGLLTATEKQVYLGRLHTRPIQWHLKNNWRVPESLEKVISVPSSLHPHLEWWLEESNVLPGQPLPGSKLALQILTDASKEGWGAHLNEHTARGTWLHI